MTARRYIEDGSVSNNSVVENDESEGVLTVACTCFVVIIKKIILLIYLQRS